MEIELRYFDDCPNWRDTLTRIRRVAEGMGVETTVTTRRVTSHDEAVALGFTGSPTLLINGVDPLVTPGASPGLACRVYRTEQGLAGAPSDAQLRAILTGA